MWITRQLNKGEHLHALRRDLRYAHNGAFTSRHLMGQTESAWCLTLLTNGVVTWTTEYCGLAVAAMRRVLQPPAAKAPPVARSSPHARLVSVITDSLPVNARLSRIRALLSGLSGPLGNGEMHAWVNLGDVEAMPRNVFDLIDGLGVFQRWYPEVPENVPESPEELLGRLNEIDQDGAIRRLIGMATTTLAYGRPGRYDQAKAGEVFSSLVRLLGHDTRWWSNTDASGGWDPVTRHVFDAVVIGVGNDVTVAVLAFDED